MKIILKRFEEFETKIMSRIDLLEISYVKQSQRIDEILFGLLGTEIQTTTVEPGGDLVDNCMEIPETNPKELVLVERNTKRKPESSPVRNSNASKKRKHEPLVVESYYDEDTEPLECQVVTSADPIEIPTISVVPGDPQKFYQTISSNLISTNDFYSQFPLLNIEDLRRFNKSLQKQKAADEFVRFMKQRIKVTHDPDEISDQILRTVISDQILIESTWASKSSGKLLVSHLTYFLKCCLRLGFFFSNTFSLDLLRARTIDNIHHIRVSNGLAPHPSKKVPKIKIEFKSEKLETT